MTDIRVQKHIHQCHPKAFCLFLGPGSTYFTTKFLTNSMAVVVRGEPEYTVREFIGILADKKNRKDVQGISYYDSDVNKIIHNRSRALIKDLDELPFPAIHFIEGYAFSNPKLKVSPYTTVVTSRNCPFKCIYCVPSSLTFAREIEYKREHDGKKPPVGFRSPENVVQEIEELAAKGYKAIGFMDDNFIVTEKRLRIIGEALKKHGIVWGCQARVDAINEEIASILQVYNCQYVDLGVESFSDEILSYTSVPLKLGRIKN